MSDWQTNYLGWMERSDIEGTWWERWAPEALAGCDAPPITYRVLEQRWDEDYTRRTILRADIV